MPSLQERVIQGIEYQNAQQPERAAEVFSEVLQQDPGNVAALYSLAVIELQRGDTDAALALCRRGIAVAPGFALLRMVEGAALQAQGHKLDALSSYDAALALDPNAVPVLLNSGVLLRDLLRHRDALDRFNRILAIEPNNPAALANCAILLTEFKQGQLAIPMFERLLRIQPDFDYGPGLLAFERLHLCDWTDFEPLRQSIVEGVRQGRRVCKSLAFMALSDSAHEHLLASQTFARHFCPPKPERLWQGERYQHRRVRIAYVSPDLREHPVGHLMAGIFEAHDRQRFETIALSLGPDDESRLRGRMLQAFDHFIDARAMGTRQIAQRLREMEVDIAIDLGGYTSDTRTEIFAYRVAPVQVNYLGFPGTMATPFHDFIIADPKVIPRAHQVHYTERVVYLPDTYLPTAAGITVAEHTPSRAECGLPPQGFVFCAFSHDFKINPPLFDVWMRLLTQVPGSMLWLASRLPIAQDNLRAQARQRGVDPDRLVFAPRLPRVEDHLARYRQADLFLDTHPYNAHTTAADALLAGLPVVTCRGDAFPSRVAGSLLEARGLTELIANSLDEYETLALKYAQNPEALRTARARVAAADAASSGVDANTFCRQLETIYLAMWRETQLCGAADELLPASQVKALP